MFWMAENTGMTEIILNTAVEVRPFRARAVRDTGLGIAINPSKTIALIRKGHAPTPKEFARLGGMQVRVVEEDGVKVVGVPVVNGAYTVDSAMEIFRSAGAE